MTALALSTDVPSASVNTVEKLAAWSGLALAAMNPAMTAIEGQGYSERVAQSNIYYIQADNKNRLIIRLSLAVSPDYLIGGAKMWTYMQELSNTALPAGFRS